MEWKQSNEALIVWGTMALLFIAIFMVVFMIDHKRKLYAKQTLIDLYENKCMMEIQELRERIEKLEQDKVEES